MKKLFALFFAITIMATLSVTAFALDEGDTVYLDTRNMTVAPGSIELVILPQQDFLPMTETTKEGIYEIAIPAGTTDFYFVIWGSSYITPSVSLAALENNMFVVNSDNVSGSWTDYDPTVEEKDTQVTYSVNPAYTVTIPASIAIDEDGTVDATVSAADVVVNKGQYVSVTLAAENNFTVKTAEGAELTYTVTKGGQSVAAGGEILAVNPASAAGGSANITFAINEADVKYAGTYTGTATFTVAVKPVS